MPRSMAVLCGWLSCAGTLAAWALSPSATLADQPLHARIDQLLEAAAVGPLAAQADDSDFLRRASLDLAGMVPTADTARAFLADPSPDKRQVLIDRLLSGAAYARHMAYLFDAMLTERQPAKAIKPQEWHEYLRRSFAENKPYDQLAREILAADGSDGPLRPAAKFYLARLAQPATLTRDVGRVFFGVDLQCAQCHNHPSIGDYLQGDYYGLYAFLSRSSNFADAKSKQAYVAEKADGEVSFKSVFTGYAADNVAPRLLKGPAIAEPVFAAGDEYLVKPAKDVRPIPKFSRRAELARIATDGASAAFNRNIVNRLWAQMFGRGIVQPVDLDHPDNPPSHPQLLALLADEFVRMRFDVRAMLRELALTRAYQRSCDRPAPRSFDAADLAHRRAICEAEFARREAASKSSQETVQKADAELKAAREANAAPIAEAAKLQTEQAPARQARTKAETELAAARQSAAARQEAASALAEAIAKAQFAVAKLTGNSAGTEDAVLTKAVEQLVTRRTALLAESAAAEKTIADRRASLTAAETRLATCQSSLAAIEPILKQLRQQDAAALQARIRAADDKTSAVAAAQRLAEVRAIEEYAALAATAAASQSAGDLRAAEQAWSGLAEDWTKRFFCRAPKPLAPEELAWSLLQAMGQCGEQEAAITAELKKSPPAGVDVANPVRAAAEVESRVHGKLQDTAGLLVSAFSSGPGQSDYLFQPSVSQALFMANAAQLRATLAPQGSNLVARLAAITDNDPLADELYLSILTRLPDAEERSEVAAYLQGRSGDRGVAIQEMTWALCTSTEFRFSR